MVRVDALSLDRARQRDSVFAFLAFACAVLVGMSMNPLLGLLIAVALVALVAADWRASAVTLVAGVTALVVLVPSDVAVRAGLPIDLSADRIAVGALCVFWALGQLRPSEVEPSEGVRRTASLLLWLLVVAVVSLFLNAARTTAAGYFDEGPKALVILASYVAMFYLTLRLVGSERAVQRIVSVAVIAGSVASVFAIIERMTRTNIVRNALLAMPLVRRTNIDRALYRGEGVRVQGTAEHPIAFGGMMAMLLPLALYLAFSSQGRARRWWSAAGCLIVAAMLFSVSRSALLSSASALVLLLLLWPAWRKTLATLALGALLVMYAFDPALVNTFRATLDPNYVIQQESDPNTSARFTDYPKVERIIPSQPLFGLGFGDFDPRRYFWLDNQVLGLMLELGAAGTLLVFAFVWRSIALMVRAAPGPDPTPLTAALAASVAAFCVLSIFFDTFAFAQVTHLFFIMAALGLRAADLRLSAPEREALAA